MSTLIKKPEAVKTAKTKSPVDEGLHAKQPVKKVAGMGFEAGSRALKPPKPGVVEQIKPSPESAKLTDRNSMRAGSEASRKPPPDLRALERLGYLVYPVASMNVLNSDPKTATGNPDQKISNQKIGGAGYDLVTSGTFYSGMSPVGAVMRDGKVDTKGADKAKNRGGVAILDDGSVVVDRMQGGSAEEIQARFGTDEHKVKDFLGGGALLVEGGAAVSSEDLFRRQRFDQKGAGGGVGIDATQMRATDHTVVAIRDGQAFVVIAKGKTGRQIQQDLLKFGFDSVVKMDGGSGQWFRDSRGRERTNGSNPTGLGVHTR